MNQIVICSWHSIIIHHIPQFHCMPTYTLFRCLNLQSFSSHLDDIALSREKRLLASKISLGPKSSKEKSPDALLNPDHCHRMGFGDVTQLLSSQCFHISSSSSYLQQESPCALPFIASHSFVHCIPAITRQFLEDQSISFMILVYCGWFPTFLPIKVPLISIILCLAKGCHNTYDFHSYMLIAYLSSDLNLSHILQKAYAKSAPSVIKFGYYAFLYLAFDASSWFF